MGGPLYSLMDRDLQVGQAELIITLTGIDDTFSQTIYARHSYLADEILWNHRFADILHLDSNGHRYVDYSHLFSGWRPHHSRRLGAGRKARLHISVLGQNLDELQ
ncbi:hypothetical protein NW870_12255 [Synechococcus sp. R50.1]|uniref:hypothetical protein n=1 Tax=unclassified Synechococcus TaxID=2626047 RepID=UPI0039C05EF8